MEPDGSLPHSQALFPFLIIFLILCSHPLFDLRSSVDEIGKARRHKLAGLGKTQKKGHEIL